MISTIISKLKVLVGKEHYVALGMAQLAEVPAAKTEDLSSNSCRPLVEGEN